jgi:hypothetical protein
MKCCEVVKSTGKHASCYVSCHASCICSCGADEADGAAQGVKRANAT